MAFKQLQSLDAETTISLGGYNKKAKKENPTSIEGYYLGNKQVEDSKNADKKNTIYYLKTAKGNVAVWGKTDMDRKMSGAKVGVMTRITHTGMKPTKNGEMYVYSVEVDADNTIEVEPNGAVRSASYNDDEPSFNASEELDEEQESNDDEEERQQTAALAAAERKAKLDALLKKPSTIKK